MLRRAIVTPDMHRVPHAVEDDETHANVGFNLPVKGEAGGDAIHQRPWHGEAAAQ